MKASAIERIRVLWSFMPSRWNTTLADDELFDLHVIRRPKANHKAAPSMKPVSLGSMTQRFSGSTRPTVEPSQLQRKTET